MLACLTACRPVVQAVASQPVTAVPDLWMKGLLQALLTVIQELHLSRFKERMVQLHVKPMLESLRSRVLGASAPSFGKRPPPLTLGVKKDLTGP